MTQEQTNKDNTAVDSARSVACVTSPRESHLLPSKVPRRQKYGLGPGFSAGNLAPGVDWLGNLVHSRTESARLKRP